MSSLLFSCNKDEGLGGSSAIEGKVYNVIHRDDNFSFTKETIPAVKEDVYLVFGDKSYFGDDVETDKDGIYRFDYLRKGNYTVYAYSKYADDHREAISQTVKIGSGTTKVPDIYIHTGKAYGTAMIKGRVNIQYYDNSFPQEIAPGVETRVYIKHLGEETHFDDVRCGDKGIFIFQKILPGKYEIWVATEDPDTEVMSSVVQTIEVTDTEKIYVLDEIFMITKKV